MRITILAHGSRGDIQPYLALGCGLQNAGYAVRLAAPRMFQSWITSFGLEYAPLSGDPVALMRGASGDAYQPGPVRTSLHVLRYVAPVAASLAEDVRAACADADGVIHTLLTTIPGHQAARERGIPDLSALTVLVFSPTSQFANPLFHTWPGWAKRFPRLAEYEPRYNYITHREFTRVFRLSVRLGYRLLHSRDPRIPLMENWPFETGSEGCPTPILYGISRHVLPQPDDWSEIRMPNQCRDLPEWNRLYPRLTGYWFLDAAPDYHPPEELERFLAAGSKPVFIGFGSMASAKARSLLRICLAALKVTGQRAVIAGGWSGFENTGHLPENVLALPEVPYDWLFPRVSMAIHHGGMGTTASALRAGIPSIVVPFAFEQPFWGRQVYALGAGPQPIPHNRMSKKRLAAAIQLALQDEAIRQNARQVGERIRSEDGVSTAVRLILAYFNSFSQ